MSLRTPLCDMLDIEHPILLAGMGGVSYHALVAAVSEAGGIGTLGASTMSVDELPEEMAAVRALTSKPFGVDLLLPASMASDTKSDRDEMRARIARDHPKHVEFVRGLMARYGLEPVVAKGEAMSADFIRAQVEDLRREAASPEELASMYAEWGEYAETPGFDRAAWVAHCIANPATRKQDTDYAALEP